MQTQFPNVNQVGGRLMPLLALAEADQRTFGRAVSQTVNLMEFHGIPQSAINPIPMRYGTQIEEFMYRACTTLQKPMIGSITALADYPAPSRLRAEGVNDDIIFKCIQHEVVPRQYALALIGAATAFESLLDASLNDDCLTLEQRIDMALKLWRGNVRSSERDRAGALLIGYEVAEPNWQGGRTDTGKIKRERYLRGLQSAVETDMLREAVSGISRRKPILGNINAPIFEKAHNRGLITRATYDMIHRAVEQQRMNSSDKPTVKVTHDLRARQAELGLIRRMKLAMKIWIGEPQYYRQDRVQADALLHEYDLPPSAQIDDPTQVDKTKRMYFMDMFRGALETNILREIAGDMKILQFVDPGIIRRMFGMGMITARTHRCVSDAIKRMDQEVHERPTAEIPIIPE